MNNYTTKRRRVATTAPPRAVTRPVAVATLAVLLVLLTAALAPTHLFGQITPEMQKAREETAVVFDLGRFFGYVHEMTTENRTLALTTAQKRSILTVMNEIRALKRIEPPWAAGKLEYLELDVLTPAQLMDIDRRAIAWQKSRDTPGSGGGSTGGSGSGPLSTYAAGGPFNPIVDTERLIGQNFQALYDLLK
jgi:uncharacterized membrane protein YgcG